MRELYVLIRPLPVSLWVAAEKQASEIKLLKRVTSRESASWESFDSLRPKYASVHPEYYLT